MKRMLPSDKHFCGKDLWITEPPELEIAEKKIIHLGQMEFLPVELKTLTAGKSIKQKIATYSSFIGLAGIIRFKGRIVRLVNTEFDTKHGFLLDAPDTLVHLLAGSLHHKHFYHDLDYKCSVLSMKYATFVLRRLLQFIVNQVVTCRKRKASTIQTFMTDLLVKGLG